MDRKIFVLFLFVFIIKAQATINEPKCFSSFDFQEKLLEKMVILSHKVDTLQRLFDEKLEELSVKANQLRDDRLAMKSELTNISTDLNNIMEAKMAIFERQQTNNLEETNQKLHTFSLDVSAISASFRDNLKPNIAFLARTVSDRSPGTNKQLVFTQTLVNTDDVYSTITGYFTAPVEGTYLFSSQICGKKGNYVNFRIFVNDEMYSDTTQYDGDSSYSCATSITVAILKVGDRVSVKTGPNTSSGTIIYQDAYTWSMFQGALVN